MNTTEERGYVLLFTLLFIGLFLLGGVGLINYSSESTRAENGSIASEQALAIAESGIDQAAAKLNANPSYTGETNTAVGAGTLTIVVTSINSSTVQITATGYVPNASSTTAKHTVKASLAVNSAAISFNYGVQAGTGGFSFTSGTVNGNIYSNGNIVATNGVTITGSAVAAGTSTIGGSAYSTGVYVGTTTSSQAWAYTMQGVTAAGSMYCQSGTYLNKSCNTSKGQAPAIGFPISNSEITGWETQAAAGGVYSGNYSVGWQGATLGPQEITGSLTVSGGGTLTVTGTLYVEGSVTLTGGGTIKLASSYGSEEGAIVTNGLIAVNGGGTFAGSGTAGSYPFLITTSTCPSGSGCGGADAVELSGGAGTVAVVAQSGTVDIGGGSSVKAVTGNTITMEDGATLTYDSGLVNANFGSGPGGSWEYIPGTYELIN